MSNRFKILAVLAAVAAVSACAAKEEPVVYAEPEPIQAEPTYNKY